MKKDQPERFIATRDVGVLIMIHHNITHPPHQIPSILPKGTVVIFKKQTGGPSWGLSDLLGIDIQDHGRFESGNVPSRIRKFHDYLGISVFILQDDAEKSFQRATQTEPQQSPAGDVANRAAPEE